MKSRAKGQLAVAALCSGLIFGFATQLQAKNPNRNFLPATGAVATAAPKARLAIRAGGSASVWFLCDLLGWTV